jgi:antitoxin VapB
MSLSIQNLEAEQLAQELARLRDEIRAIAQRCAALPVLDPRSPEEILGYDSHGLPR